MMNPLTMVGIMTPLPSLRRSRKTDATALILSSREMIF